MRGESTLKNEGCSERCYDEAIKSKESQSRRLLFITKFVFTLSTSIYVCLFEHLAREQKNNKNIIITCDMQT